MTSDEPGALPITDSGMLDALKELWERHDPVPADLTERICFALSLEDLEVELARMEETMLAGARGEERVRTVTFSSASLSVMVTIGDEPDGTVRLDGWIDGGGGLQVELRAQGGQRTAPADEDGRFAFDRVSHGLAQLVFHPTPAAGTDLSAPVVTPAVQV